MSRAPSPPERLRAMQKLVGALVTAPNGVDAALEGRPGVPGWLDAWVEPGQALAASVASDEKLAAAARLDVYAQAYFARLHEVLSEDFPTVAWLCGEAAFHDLVTSYLVAHPSRDPNLRALGAAFAAFVDTHPVNEPVRTRWPALAGLARLERAFADVFDAANEPVLTRDALGAVSPEAWAGLDLTLVAACRPLSFGPRVAGYVSARRDGHDVPELDAGPEHVVVWRDGERAVFRRVGAAEAAALALAREGVSFGDLCVHAEERVGEAEAAATAAGWLGAWVDAAWLRALPEAPGVR